MSRFTFIQNQLWHEALPQIHFKLIQIKFFQASEHYQLTNLELEQILQSLMLIFNASSDGLFLTVMNCTRK